MFNWDDAGSNKFKGSIEVVRRKFFVCDRQRRAMYYNCRRRFRQFEAEVGRCTKYGGSRKNHPLNLNDAAHCPKSLFHGPG